jgi:hypothetical protein
MRLLPQNRRRPALLLSLLIAGPSLACARHAGSSAVGGAIDTLQKKSDATKAATGETPVEAMAGRAVDGAFSRLTSPEQMAALRQIVHNAVNEAVTSALDAASRPVGPGGDGRVELLAEGAATALRSSLSEGFVTDLGDEGHGPLANSLSATVRQAAAAATDGALLRLLPDCTVDDPGCLDRRVSELSQGAASGFMRGVRDGIKLAALLLSFVAGLACATIAGLTVALVRRREKGV